MKKLSIATLACCALAANAASSVGTIDNVVGTVSIGGQGFVSQAKSGTPLVEGSTVLVSSKSKATLALANGCTVSLLGSQHFTVNSKLSCEQSIASVTNLAATTRVAQASIGTGTGGAAGGAGAAGASAAGGLGLGVGGVVALSAAAVIAIPLAKTVSESPASGS